MASNNSGKKWTTDEEIKLKILSLSKRKSIDELAKDFQRSEGSIKTRLAKIKHTSLDSLHDQKFYENSLASENEGRRTWEPPINHKSGIDKSWELYGGIFNLGILSFPVWFFALEKDLPADAAIFIIIVWLLVLFFMTRGGHWDTHANDDQFDDFND